MSSATTVLVDQVGDSTVAGLDISFVDYSFTDTTYTQTIHFDGPIDLNFEFWLDTSFSIYETINDYTRIVGANYYNAGDATGYGRAHGFNTQENTTIFNIGSNFISAEFIRSDISFSSVIDCFNVDPVSYKAIGANLVTNTTSGWILADNLDGATLPIPEPNSVFLLGAGLTWLFGVRKRMNLKL